ncbi:MAG: hypothetical protein R6X35_09340 [Candidatus Krumholzibacteriia bacterium]
MARLLAAVLACWLAAGAGPATAPAQAQDQEGKAADWERGVRQERAWLGRTLHRFFGRAPRSGAELAGRAEELVARYARYAGRPIEVVIVHPVLRFASGADAAVASDRGALERLATPLWSYTRESVVRQYLLFAAGDRLDPFRLADSERMLRQLEYMNDVRLLVVPIGDGESVAVVVETRDRWPLGVTGDIVDRDRYEGGVFWTNGLGVGLRLDNKLLVHRERDPEVGYRGYLAKQNVAGTFVDAVAAYENSWRELRRGLAIERRAVHPAIRWVGGWSWERTDDRDNEGLLREFDRDDAWLGRVIPLDRRRTATGGRRRVLTPALGLTATDFHSRPATVSRDTLRDYHDGRTWLFSLTWASLTDYRTSYLFRMGETEDLPGGLVLKASAGYEDGEFLRRTPLFVEGAYVGVAAGGEVAWCDLAGGGFLREGVFEDGLATARLGYITPLAGAGTWRHRTYAQLAYLLGINRTRGAGVVLGDRSGVRGLSNTEVRGDQRLVLKLETRVFTPWRVLGFDSMLFGFGDLGLAGGEDDPLLEQKAYASLGLGVRVANPDLVLPIFEVRAGLLTNVDEPGFALAFDLGNQSYPEIELPGPRPRRVPYR